MLLILSAHFAVATLGGSGWAAVCAILCAYVAGTKAPKGDDDE
mgnify:CR=1 FL=1